MGRTLSKYTPSLPDSSDVRHMLMGLPCSASYVINTWAKLAAWTGFCETRDIPYGNLADWVSTLGYGVDKCDVDVSMLL